MSTYSENYQKLMTEKKAQVDAAFSKAKEIAMSHTLLYVQDDDGDPYPLTEMLTLQGQTIDRGIEEIDKLLDSMLIDALMAYEGMLDS